MLKFWAGGWDAAEQENQELRDARREQFWAEIGVTPSTETKDIDIDPANRVATLQALANRTATGREQDAQLKATAQLAVVTVAGISLGSFSPTGSIMKMLPWGELHPYSYEAFFNIWHITAYELSLENK